MGHIELKALFHYLVLAKLSRNSLFGYEPSALKKSFMVARIDPLRIHR